MSQQEAIARSIAMLRTTADELDRPFHPGSECAKFEASVAERLRAVAISLELATGVVLPALINDLPYDEAGDDDDDDNK
jgi:hypothetical protein